MTRFLVFAILMSTGSISPVLAQLQLGAESKRSSGADAAVRIGSLPTGQFVNPIAEGADPWIIRDPNRDRYLWCLSDGNQAIAIHASESLTSLGSKRIVWRAPETGPVSRDVWAPELHYLDNRWFIYFAASDGKNENHLAYVLKSKTRDPMGEYELRGPFATGDGENGKSPNIWAIDMTVLKHQGKRYALWSGWDAPGTDQQYLFIAPMKSPTQLAGPRVRLCGNDDYVWERVTPDESRRGLNEGPQVFQEGKATVVVYSCGASWLGTYKLGMLELVGGNPLAPSSWKKRETPVFSGTEAVYGVGHSCFVKSIDGRQWWHVYHAKRDRNPGWRRTISMQPMHVDERGLPVFGSPVPFGVPLDRPLEDPVVRVSTDTHQFSYYGHHQFVAVDRDSIDLGRVPVNPVNDYRSGEKIVLDDHAPADVHAHVTIDFHGDAYARDAGVLLRCTAPSIGYDAQRAYFVGLIPKNKLVVLGITDGDQWTELARAKTAIDVSEPQRLSVEIVNDQITAWHNGNLRINHRDDTYRFGSAGLRVVDTHATFREFTVKDAGRD